MLRPRKWLIQDMWGHSTGRAAFTQEQASPGLALRWVAGSNCRNWASSMAGWWQRDGQERGAGQWGRGGPSHCACKSGHSKEHSSYWLPCCGPAAWRSLMSPGLPFGKETHRIGPKFSMPLSLGGLIFIICHWSFFCLFVCFDSEIILKCVAQFLDIWGLSCYISVINF